MTAFKCQAHARELKQRLSFQIKGATFTETTDSQGQPRLKMTASSETIFIAIDNDGNAGRTDGLGLAQRVYSPHICTILQDSTPTSIEVRSKTLAACAKLGMKLELYEVNPLPSSYDLTGATRTAEIRSDEQNPLTISQ